jgi:hypothetical protein
MSPGLGLARAAALLLVPLCAFFVGPAVAAIEHDRLPRLLLFSTLPTVLPIAALVVVGVASYRRTRSARTTGILTALALVIVLVGALTFLVIAWPTGS